MNEKFMKDFNGEKIFSLEYDKETLRDLVIDKQEEIERLKELIKTLYFREDKYTFKEFTEEQLELLNNILYGSDKE